MKCNVVGLTSAMPIVDSKKVNISASLDMY